MGGDIELVVFLGVFASEDQRFDPFFQLECRGRGPNLGKWGSASWVRCLKSNFVVMELMDDLIADVFPAEEDFGFDPVAGDPLGVGGEERSFADIFEFEEGHGEPLEAHAKAAVRRHPIFEDAEVVAEIGGIHSFQRGSLRPSNHRCGAVGRRR